MTSHPLHYPQQLPLSQQLPHLTTNLTTVLGLLLLFSFYCYSVFGCGRVILESVTDFDEKAFRVQCLLKRSEWMRELSCPLSEVGRHT